MRQYINFAALLNHVSDEDTGEWYWTAYIPMPGLGEAWAEGETREEAIASARDVILLHLECAVAEGDTIDETNGIQASEMVVLEMRVPTVAEADANESGLISLDGVRKRFGEDAYETVQMAIINGVMPFQTDAHMVKPRDVRALLDS